MVAREGRVVIDLACGVVQVEGRAVALNAAEWRVLAVLGGRVGPVLTHDEILTLAFGSAYRGAGRDAGASVGGRALYGPQRGFGACPPG